MKAGSATKWSDRIQGGKYPKIFSRPNKKTAGGNRKILLPPAVCNLPSIPSTAVL
jgi:hypothetical protein